LFLSTARRQQIDVANGVGQPCCFKESLTVCSRAALALRVSEADENFGPMTVVGVGGTVGQFEGLGIPADGFVRGELV
jgi:hypothetical protein